MTSTTGDQRTLITNARLLHAPPHAASAIVFGPLGIEWLGPADRAPGPDDVAVRIDAAGRLVTQGFVDAHVHATNTGLALIGLDLSLCTSRTDLLARIERYAQAHPGSHIIGHGWDETRWPNADMPTLDELDRAAGGRPAYLSRADVHSALVTSALREEVAHLSEFAGFDPGSPVLTRQAHGQARTHAFSSIDHATRMRAQRAFLDHAASRGVSAVHEMAGPTISGEADALALQTQARNSPTPEVFLYWGELASRGGIERARSLGARGVGGDLFLDGALGSRTAALHEPYSDDPETSGALYIDAEETVEHLMACTSAGFQAGFHVIGDRACDVVAGALRQATMQLGPDAHRLRHRLEHAEMLSDEALSSLAGMGVILSMQPLFDELWSNPGGMYEQRLGVERSKPMNRWGSAIRNGATVAFSSDCPVTELSPWAAIRASMNHHDPRERLDLQAALDAHTRAGWIAVGEHNAGELRVGYRADIALWDAEIDAGWSVLPSDAPLPTCVANWVAGTCVFGSIDAELPGECT